MAFTKQKEFEIRSKFETGENLKDLAIKYKIPLATLKARKKKSEKLGDPWIKNSKSKQEYKNFLETSEEEKAKIEKKLNQRFKNQLDRLEADIQSKYMENKKEAGSLSGGIENSALIRLSRIKKIIGLRKAIENIPATTKEKLQLERMKIENEIKKLEMREKKADVELKEETAKFYTKKD